MAIATKKVAQTTTTPKKASRTKSVSVELTAEGKKALADFRNAKKAEAKAKEQKEKAELALREALGDHKEGTIEGISVVKVVGGKNTHFDREMMKEMFPEAFISTLRETIYTYIKTL
jgi:hypothetical protein